LFRQEREEEIASQQEEVSLVEMTATDLKTHTLTILKASGGSFLMTASQVL
jgi:hypothetical protein